jgi:hypothetical protein
VLRLIGSNARVRAFTPRIRRRGLIRSRSRFDASMLPVRFPPALAFALLVAAA